MDEESLRSYARPQSSRMNVFLFVSIVIVFIVFGAMVATVVVVMNLQSEVAHLRSIKVSSFGTQPDDYSEYKMQNLASLEAIDAELKNGTMTWSSVKYLRHSSVGSKFDFDDRKHTLHPKQEGSYFIYLDFTFSCTYQCSATLLTVQLGDKLTCNMEIPKSAEKTLITRTCWTVAYMDGNTRLLAQMSLPGKEVNNWSLKMSKSKMGMFLVE